MSQGTARADARSYRGHGLRLPPAFADPLPAERWLKRGGRSIAVLAAVAVVGGISTLFLPVRTIVKGTGVLAPTSVWSARSVEEGLIAQVLVRAGDTVQAGQPLILLDPFGEEVRLAQLRLALKQHELDEAHMRGTLPLTANLKEEAVTAASLRVNTARAELVDQMVTNSSGANVDSLLRRYVFGLHVALDLAVAKLKAAESGLRAARAEARLAQLDRFDVGKEAAIIAGMRADVEAGEERLRRLTVRAPASGVVLTEDLDRLPGAAVEPGDQLLEIGKLTAWQARIRVGEGDVREVHIGDSATVDVPALERMGSGMLHGRVVAVGLEPGDGLTSAGSWTPLESAGSGPRVAGRRGFYRVVVAIDAAEAHMADSLHLRRGFTAKVIIVTGHARIAQLLSTRGG